MASNTFRCLCVFLKSVNFLYPALPPESSRSCQGSANRKKMKISQMNCGKVSIKLVTKCHCFSPCLTASTLKCLIISLLYLLTTLSEASAFFCGAVQTQFVNSHCATFAFRLFSFELFYNFFLFRINKNIFVAFFSWTNEEQTGGKEKSNST